MVSRSASGAAVDRYEGDRQQHTSVITLDTTADQRAKEGSRSVDATTVEYDGEDEADEYEDELYYEGEYEDGISGDYEMELPRGEAATFVTFSYFYQSKM